MAHDPSGHARHDRRAPSQPPSSERKRHGKRSYALLALNLGLSFVAMYLVMFVMIDSWADFYNNINMVYMALMMLAPMAVLMLLTMGGMYGKRRLNAVLYAGFGAVFILSYLAIRSQALVGDQQFIASMIPHHSGAILMCREAALEDAELQALCGQIAEAQRREILQMQAIQSRLAASAID